MVGSLAAQRSSKEAQSDSVGQPSLGEPLPLYILKTLPRPLPPELGLELEDGVGGALYDGAAEGAADGAEDPAGALAAGALEAGAPLYAGGAL